MYCFGDLLSVSTLSVVGDQDFHCATPSFRHEITGLLRSQTQDDEPTLGCAADLSSTWHILAGSLLS